MANFIFTVPSLEKKYIDFRTPITGDSYNWSWVRPLTQVTSIAIHHSAGPDTQTPEDIARYHVKTLGWGGVGYHFIITNDATVYYVGDLNTARAHVKNKNESSIGVCLIGTFMNSKQPNDNQIMSAHRLCSRLLFETPEIPNINGWEDIYGHKELGSVTACPGDTWPLWKPKLLSGIASPDNANNSERVAEITKMYQIILGRDPDQDGLLMYVKSKYSLDQIRKIMTESLEHKSIIERAQSYKKLKALAQNANTYLLESKKAVDELIQNIT